MKAAATDGTSGKSRKGEGGLGVRVFLFLAFGSCAVLPLAYLGIQWAERSAAYEVAAADRQTLASATALALQISTALGGYERSLGAVCAQIAALDELDGERTKKAVVAHSEHHPEFVGAYVADPEGQALLFYSTGKGFIAGGGNYRDREYFQELLRTQQTAISRVQVGRITKVPAIAIACPIIDDDGKLQGVFTNSIDLRQILDLTRHVATGLGEGRVLVIDQEGMVVADSEKPGTLTPAPSSAVFGSLENQAFQLRVGRDEDGAEVRAAAVSLSAPVAAWRVVALKSKEVVERRAVAIRNQTGIVALIVAFATMIVAAVVAGWAARPLRALAHAAENVARGDYQRIPETLNRGPREVRTLAQAVRGMVNTLRSHAETLEELVLQRTEQLQKANTDLGEALTRAQTAERETRADIEKARVFQERMLPALPSATELDVSALYLPLQQVGGDIYDVCKLGPGRFRAFIADATGHGVQASLRTMLLKAAYDRLKEHHAKIPDLLRALNTYLVSEFPEGDLHCAVTCVDIEYRDADTARVSYCTAGGSPLYCFSKGKVTEHHSTGALLGVVDLTWPEAQSFLLTRGDALLICSDGLTEQWNEQRQRFDETLQTQSLMALASSTLTLSELTQRFHTFRGNKPPMDDVTALLVQLPS